MRQSWPALLFLSRPSSEASPARYVPPSRIVGNMAFWPYVYGILATVVRVASRILFPTDEPLPAERMIGRVEDVDELAAQLRGGIHRILAAPRRTGKSPGCRCGMGRLGGGGPFLGAPNLFELTSIAALAEGMAQL